MQFPVNQAVADAPDVDHELVVAVAAQLPPQPRGVAVERPRVPERLHAPRSPRISSARVNTLVGSPASVTSRSYSFADSSTGRSYTRTSRERTSIDDRARAQDPGRAAQRRAPQHRGDPGAQLRVGERLADDVVAAALEHPDPLQPVRVAAQHDQRDIRVDPAGETLAGADRVDQRERLAVDVDQDQVRDATCSAARAPSPGRARSAPGSRQRPGWIGEERARSVVLLGDQDGRSGLRHVTSSEVVVVNL